MVAFAFGGIAGDVFFHLIPEIFLGEEDPDQVRFVMVESNKNILLGVAIVIGFLTFVAMDKALRIATGGSGHDHSHRHAHSHDENAQEAIKASPTKAKASGASVSLPNKDLRSRKVPAAEITPASTDASKSSPSIKLSAYLNLIADFTHNITDGLALSSSFYASSTLGATTTAAVFFHEIPHEVGDFALLIQSGFSKKRAMGAQFVTAVGAFLGTCLGIAIQEYGQSDGGDAAAGSAKGQGLAGTDLGWADLLLAWTAGTFIFVMVSVIPELLETGENKKDELLKTAKQFTAIGLGAGIMLA